MKTAKVKHRIPKEGILLPVKRIAAGKYLRRRVKDPAKIERGERLLAMWNKEDENAEYAPTVYAHIAWKGQDQQTDAEVTIHLRGMFHSKEAIDKAARAKLEKWTGKIQKSDEATGPSPGLVLVAINKTPSASMKHRYDPRRTTRAGRYGLGYNVKN